MSEDDARHRNYASSPVRNMTLKGSPAQSFVGVKFCRWTISEIMPERNKYGAIIARCDCECGTKRIVMLCDVVRGDSRSCGCLGTDLRTKHGHRSAGNQTGTYKTWSSMIARCTDENHAAFSRYGGSGILICSRWLGESGFQNFLSDMGSRPSGKTIDRIDTGGGYNKDNCRWASSREQSRNRRSSRFLEFNGERRTVAEWSERNGIGYGTLRSRIVNGWTIEDALTTPTRRKAKSSHK